MPAGGLALGKRVPDVHAAQRPQDGEGEQEQGPCSPVRGVRRCLSRGDEATDDERLNADAKVGRTIHDADRDTGILRASEVSSHRPREDPMNADHGHRDDHGDQAGIDQGPVERGSHDHDRGDHEDVQHTGRRSASGLEESVAGPAGQDCARHPADQEREPPVVRDPEVMLESDVLGEQRVPVHDPVAEQTGAELDSDHNADHRVLEHPDERCHHRQALAVFGYRLFAGLEVGEAGLARRVLEPSEHRDPAQGQQRGRDEEDDPVLVHAGVPNAENGAEQGGPEAEVGVERPAAGVDEGESPVEREEHAERDHEPEDRRELAALLNMEPRRLGGDDADRAEALEEHVQRVHPREGCQDVHLPTPGRDAVEHEAHQEVHHDHAACAEQHAVAAAEAIHNRSAEQEADAVHQGADAEDVAELLLGHQVAQRGLRYGQVVPSHVEEGVGESEREPVGEPSKQVATIVARKVLIHGQSPFSFCAHLGRLVRAKSSTTVPALRLCVNKKRKRPAAVLWCTGCR